MFVKGRRADFGTLGDSTGISDVKQAMDTAKEVKSVAGGDGGGGCMDGMCACKGTEAAAKSAKQAEVQKANPVPVDANGKEIQENDPACGPECKAAYQRRREEMAAWQKNEDLKASLKLPSVVKEGFAFAAELGKGLKAKDIRSKYEAIRSRLGSFRDPNMDSTFESFIAVVANDSMDFKGSDLTLYQMYMNAVGRAVTTAFGQSYGSQAQEDSAVKAANDVAQQIIQQMMSDLS